MKPEYKRVKILAPHCPNCKQELMGNNSIALPWQCECGVWQANKYPFMGEYEVSPNLLK